MNFLFHHVAITVQDLVESISWYKKMLNFKLVKQYHQDDMSIALIQHDIIRLELFHFQQTNPLPEEHKTLFKDLHIVGTKHLCLQTDNLMQTIQQLKKKGVVFETQPDTLFFGGSYIFFKDCNGILIKLYQP